MSERLTACSRPVRSERNVQQRRRHGGPGLTLSKKEKRCTRKSGGWAWRVGAPAHPRGPPTSRHSWRKTLVASILVKATFLL